MPRWSLRPLGAYVLPCGVAFLVGISLGTWKERVRHNVLDFSGAVDHAFLLSQHADVQYCEAEYDAAHEAVSRWLDYLQELKPIHGTTEFRNPLMSPRGIAVDKALALGRLALLEERRGRTDTANDFWRRAVDEARVANWKDDSESGVRAVVAGLDNCQGRAPKP